MKFKSKSQLAEHFRMLEHAGYITAIWHREPSSPTKTRVVKSYIVNYDKVQNTKTQESQS